MRGRESQTILQKKKKRPCFLVFYKDGEVHVPEEDIVNRRTTWTVWVGVGLRAG